MEETRKNLRRQLQYLCMLFFLVTLVFCFLILMRWFLSVQGSDATEVKYASTMYKGISGEDLQTLIVSHKKRTGSIEVDLEKDNDDRFFMKGDELELYSYIDTERKGYTFVTKEQLLGDFVTYTICFIFILLAFYLVIRSIVRMVRMDRLQGHYKTFLKEKEDLIREVEYGDEDEEVSEKSKEISREIEEGSDGKVEYGDEDEEVIEKSKEISREIEEGDE